MANEELQIDYKYYESGQCSFDDLKEATGKLTVATQSQFQEIKNEKWFNRVFNMVTFSKKNDIRMADQVGNVAQAQQIMMEILMRLSGRDSKISDLVSESFEKIKRLSENDVLLAKKLKQLENSCLGISKQTDIDELSEAERQILGGLFYDLINNFDEISEQQRHYANAILNYLEVEAQNIDIRQAIESLNNIDRKRKMLTCCMEYGYLNQFNFDYIDSFEDMINDFDFGNKTIKLIKDGIIATNNLRGVNGFIDKYGYDETLEFGEEFVVEFEDDDLEELKDIDNKDQGIKNENKKNEFAEIENSIKKAIASGKIGKTVVLEPNDIEKKTAKLLPTIIPKTVIAITKVKNGKLVFTTFAMYYIQKESIDQINYAEISEEKISIDFNTGAFSFRVSNDQKIIISDERIDAKVLQKLMCELQDVSEFPNSDTATPINEMSEEIRTAYLRLIYYVVTASKCEDYEIYKKADQYDVTKNWEVINNGIYDDRQFEAELEHWKSSMQYPSEETAEVLMIIDICKILQFTRDSDDIPTTSEKYFEKICQFEKEKEENIINFALSEKKSIEQRITFEAYKKVLEGFAISLGGVGISVLAYSSIWTTFLAVSWFNFIPGAGTLISLGIVGSSAIKNVIDQKKNKKFNTEELRIRLFKEQYEDYELTIRDAESEGYLKIASNLKKAKDILCTKAKLTYNVKIIEDDDEIYGKISEKVKKCIGSAETCGSLFSKYSDKEKRKLLNDMVIPGIIEKIEDVIAYYNVKFFAEFTGSCSGILFVKKGIYYKDDPSSHIIYIPYVDMKSVTEHMKYLIIATKDDRVIKCKGLLFTSNGLPQLFNEIIDMLV